MYSVTDLYKYKFALERALHYRLEVRTNTSSYTVLFPYYNLDPPVFNYYAVSTYGRLTTLAVQL